MYSLYGIMLHKSPHSHGLARWLVQFTRLNRAFKWTNDNECRIKAPHFFFTFTIFYKETQDIHVMLRSLNAPISLWYKYGWDIIVKWCSQKVEFWNILVFGSFNLKPNEVISFSDVCKINRKAFWGHLFITLK